MDDPGMSRRKFSFVCSGDRASERVGQGETESDRARARGCMTLHSWLRCPAAFRSKNAARWGECETRTRWDGADDANECVRFDASALAR